MKVYMARKRKEEKGGKKKRMKNIRKGKRKRKKGGKKIKGGNREAEEEEENHIYMNVFGFLAITMAELNGEIYPSKTHKYPPSSFLFLLGNVVCKWK